MSKEAMKLALEALEYIHQGANNQGPHTGISWRCVSNKAELAIAALRQAIANEAFDKKAENARELGLDYEPVCNKDPQGCWNVRCQLGKKCKNTPAQRKPLTDEQIAKEVEAELTHYWNGEYIDTTGARDQLTAFARAIEAAHGIGEKK